MTAVDIDAASAKETARLVEKEGGRATAVTADVSCAADCARMVEVAERAFGGLHVLFNNAGISHIDDGDAVADFDDQDAVAGVEGIQLIGPARQ